MSFLEFEASQILCLKVETKDLFNRCDMMVSIALSDPKPS